jgi:hypothetical protein
MPLIRNVSEGLARKTSRRGLFGRGASTLFAALAGVAAGRAAQQGEALVIATSCTFPGPTPCPCHYCRVSGTCAKPCVILTQFYASGCWVSATGATCCDCDCTGRAEFLWCGCGTDYHNDVHNCPEGATP